MLSERAVRRLPEQAAADSFDAAQPCLLLVGPEGGFTADEVELAEHSGFGRFSLGSLILRSETAVIAALTLVRYFRGELGGKLGR